MFLWAAAVGSVPDQFFICQVIDWLLQLLSGLLLTDIYPVATGTKRTKWRCLREGPELLKRTNFGVKC